MTFRAVRILKEVELIAAEDTRHSRKLLTHFGISKPLTSYFDHNSTFKGGYILDKLKSGISVALISDAGTPCISDPGYQLVREAVACGIPVIPVPGVSAAITALSASGLPTDSFTFIGFLPNRSGKRREKLESLKTERRVLVFYESPHRIQAAIADMYEIFGERTCVIARELTKIHEEFIRGGLGEIRVHLQERLFKGEAVVLIEPAEAALCEPMASVGELVRQYLSEGFSVKDVARRVSSETGCARSEAYEEALAVARES